MTRQQKLVLAAVSTALFMTLLDNTVVNVALPSIQKALHASLGTLEWTVNAYTLGIAAFLVTGGRPGALLGPRRVFLPGLVCLANPSAAGGPAPPPGATAAPRPGPGAS